MKIDEPFNPFIKSKNAPEGLVFKIANYNDRIGITNLMAERNPRINFENLLENTDKELSRFVSDDKYKLYVVELQSQIVGLCRFFHSDGLPANKKMHDAPSGWYGTGILVAKQFRRQRIAQFLTYQRIQILKAMEVKEFYSVVDTKNLTSMKMHQEFGFIEVARGEGFLQFSFKDSIGCLFKLTI